MIVFFGPAGAGKSTQGQILADAYNWSWISPGQLLRESLDVELMEVMKKGKLVSPEKVNELMGNALVCNQNSTNVILDGFPRQLVQAHWLIENGPKYNRFVDLVIMLEISKPELFKRLHARGRIDDTPEIIDERIKLYEQEISLIVDYFIKNGIKIVHINGAGTVDEVHDRIIKELAVCNLV